MNDSELIQRLRRLETDVQPNPAFADALFSTLQGQAVSRRTGFRMPHNLFAAAAVAGFAVVVATAIFAFMSSRPVEPGRLPTPVSTPIAPASPDTSGEVRLVSSTTYGSLTFSEPFHFLMPPVYPIAEDEDTLQGIMTEWGSSHALQIGNGRSWEGWFLDDSPVNSDVCDWVKGRRADVPATPEEVGDWLRASSWMTVSEPVEIPVDGRMALRFDVELQNGCSGFQAPMTPPDVFEGIVYYAIPTGDDTILFVVWSDRESETFVRQASEFLVRSMTFDAD